jgi:hypothetical protein
MRGSYGVFPEKKPLYNRRTHRMKSRENAGHTWPARDDGGDVGTLINGPDAQKFLLH